MDTSFQLQPGNQGAFGLGAFVMAIDSGLSVEQIKTLLPQSGLVVGERIQRVLSVDATGARLIATSQP
jgi:hypothetical protein